MNHKMNLQEKPFNAIKDWEKTIEIRLLDKKRSKISVWDTLEFNNEPYSQKLITTTVIELLCYDTFTKLFEHEDIWLMGYDNIDELSKDVYSFYSKEKEAKYWVVGVKFKIK